MSGALPNWIRALAVRGAAGAGEGTVWSLDSTWAWAPWITLLFALFAVLWIGLIYARERPGSRGYRTLLAGLRLAIVALVMLMIAEIDALAPPHRTADGRRAGRRFGQHGHRRSLRRCQAACCARRSGSQPPASKN